MDNEFKRELQEQGLESLGIFYGSYKAFVHSNNDPDGKGRLLITCPEIYGEDFHDYWALPKGGFAGKEIGFSFIPENGDCIWVSFEKGDPRFPIWEAGWFIENAPSDNPNIRKIKTKTCEITFNDEDDSLEIKHGSNTVMMDSKGFNIISDKINLGKLDGAKEKAVYGDPLKNILNDLLTALEVLTVTCTAPGTPSSPPINLAQFTLLKGRLNCILSNKVTLD